MRHVSFVFNDHEGILWVRLLHNLTTCNERFFEVSMLIFNFDVGK